jgi:hypothetical protein
MYSGILAFLALAVTLVFGIVKFNYKIHMAAGVIAFVLASIHTGLILYRNIKMKLGRRGK